MPKPLDLKKVSDISVRFNNTFIGKTRVLNIKAAGAEYFLACHDSISKFSAKILIWLQISGFDAVLALKVFPNLELFDEQFAGIDLELLPDDIRVDVANLVFKDLLTNLSDRLKLDICITSVEFCPKCAREFEHEMGLTVFDGEDVAVLVANVLLGTQLLDSIIDSFNDIPAIAKPSGSNLLFDIFLEAGRTELSESEFDNLETSDIIFFDRDSQLHGGIFTLCGIDSPKITGNFDGSVFKVSNVVK
jgi:hypothetical protein